MIQVLERGFKILEWLARAEAPPRTLSEIAHHIGVSPAACSHIVKTLVHYGYVVQIAPRKGYRLGPMAAMLGRHHNPNQFLIQVGQPLVEKIAAETGETTLIACLHGTRRLILCQAEGKQTIRVSSDAIVLEDIYTTATGRALLAFMPADERDALLKASPPEAPAWDFAETEQEARAALAETRALGFAFNPNHNDVVQLAYPVYAGRALIASIGCFAPMFRFDKTHQEEMHAALKTAADELSTKLSGSQELGVSLLTPSA